MMSINKKYVKAIQELVISLSQGIVLTNVVDRFDRAPTNHVVVGHVCTTTICEPVWPWVLRVVIRDIAGVRTRDLVLGPRNHHVHIGNLPECHFVLAIGAIL